MIYSRQLVIKPHLYEEVTMAEINEKMTADRAKEILSAESFINYSKDELLAAVEALRGDATQKDLIAAFQSRYYGSLNKETPDYNEYQTLMGIFAETDYQEKLEKEVKEIAAQSAKNINEGRSNDMSFADLDNTQALFGLSVVPQNNDLRKARTKLNALAEKKIDDLLAEKTLIGIDELEAAQRLVGRMGNKKQQAVAQRKLDEVLMQYEEENGLNKDEKVLRKNDITLGEHLEGLQLYAEDGKVTEEFKGLAQMVDNLELVEDDGTTLGAEEKQKNLTRLFEAVKLEAHQENIGSMKYLLASKKAQREQLAEKVRDLFVAKLGQAGIASTFEQPTFEEQLDDNKYKAYLERRIKAANEFAAKLAKGGQKLKVKVNNIIMACADTDINVSRFAQRLEAKIGQGSSVLGQKLNSFRDKAVALWGKRYEISRNVVKNIQENKWQHITNLSASAMVWGAGLAAPALTLPAVGAYAVYSAAGNFWWPVVEEARKQRAAAEKDGQKMGFWPSITKAWQIKKQDRSYQNRAGWGIMAGAAGAALGLGGFTMGLETVAARAGATLSRSLSSLAAQTMTYLGARADYKKDPSEENKGKLRSAKISLGIAAVGAGLSSYFSVNRLAAHTDWQSQAQMSTPLREGWGKLPAEDVAESGAGKGPLIVEEPAAAAKVDAEASEVAQNVAAEPKIGDEIYRKDYGNGIVETRTLGKNGIAYQQVSGLSGGVKTSAAVEAFYEKRIHNMNQFNELVKVLPDVDGKTMTANQAVEAMLKQINEGFVALPEGMTPAHAVHTAFMHAHYTGDMSALRALSCPNGEDTVKMFGKLAPQYSTDNGFIGRPISSKIKLPMRAGTINIKTPCEVTSYEGTEDVIVKQEGIHSKPIEFPNSKLKPLELEKIVADLPKAPADINKLEVNYMAEPAAEAVYPSAYAQKGIYPGASTPGYEVNLLDRDEPGVTAKGSNGKFQITSHKDAVELHVEDRNGISTQTQKYFNVENGYEPLKAKDVEAAAATMGGKPEEIFAAVDEDGKTSLHYITKEGVTVTFDPDKGYAATVGNLGKTGVPYPLQEEAVKEAAAALKEQQINVNDVTNAPQSNLTEISVKGKKGVVQRMFAHFTNVKGR